MSSPINGMSISVNDTGGTGGLSLIQDAADFGADRRAHELAVVEREEFNQRAAFRRKLAHFENAAQGKRMTLKQVANERRFDQQESARISRPEQRERPEFRRVRTGENASAADDKKENALAAVDPLNEAEPELDGWLTELRNEYGQHLKQHSMTEQDMERLKDENSDSIQAGIDTAALLDKEGGDASGAMARLRSVFQEGKGSIARAPQKLIELLVAKFGSQKFLNSMQVLRMEIGAALRSHTASDLGKGAVEAYQMGAAFHQVQSAVAVASKLRADLGDAGIMPCSNQIGLVGALVGLGDAETDQVDRLVNAAVERADTLSPKQRAAAYRLLGEAVETLPTTLWPPKKLSLRLELLKDIAARLRKEQERTGKEARATPEEQLETRLRREMAALRSGKAFSERAAL